MHKIVFFFSHLYHDLKPTNWSGLSAMSLFYVCVPCDQLRSWADAESFVRRGPTLKPVFS